MADLHFETLLADCLGQFWKEDVRFSLIFSSQRRRQPEPGGCCMTQLGAPSTKDSLIVIDRDEPGFPIETDIRWLVRLKIDQCVLTIPWRRRRRLFDSKSRIGLVEHSHNFLGIRHRPELPRQVRFYSTRQGERSAH